MDRPDFHTSDEQLAQMLIRDLARHGPVTEVRPGVIQVELPVEGTPGTRRVEIRMTAAQLRERVTFLSSDGQEVLGIADPVEAGLAMFSIHLEEDLATLRPTEQHLLWHQGRLHPSVHLEWPPVRGPLDQVTLD